MMRISAKTTIAVDANKKVTHTFRVVRNAAIFASLAAAINIALGILGGQWSHILSLLTLLCGVTGMMIGVWKERRQRGVDDLEESDRGLA
jgi:hypothetical protein